MVYSFVFKIALFTAKNPLPPSAIPLKLDFSVSTFTRFLTFSTAVSSTNYLS